jgi:valyl-tRNA synthetase
MEIPTRYDFRSVEPRTYQLWLDRKCFASVYDQQGRPRDESEADKPGFVIVIPPPNVTGRLHMGHALNNSIQDVLIRYKRMDGYDALWVPGTDHAGISTQTVVRKQLDAKGIDYRELGREKFVEKVWEWKAKYGDFIIKQLQKMGCSCDWERTRFTMDEGLSHAVRTSFKTLYDRGLVYRGLRMVNWCPVDRTALSDDEVEVADGGEPGHLWYIRYPLVEPEDDIEHLVLATTRPETLFGDVAVAVNPEDTRYKKLVGKHVRLPLQGRIIPIISDPYVDVTFGTGCLKITPAHDINDFDVGQRHHLEPINVMNEDATLNDVVPAEFRGLDRFVARKKTVEALRKENLIEKTEERMVPLGRAQRSGAVIEYRLSNQWFVKMAPMAEKALLESGYQKNKDKWEKTNTGKLRFHAERWENIYARWLIDIRDWCISRQIWWGHRIPAWYHRDSGEILVDINEPEAVRQNPEAWRQDPDVLDTWFSSWLWPLSTLGWPDSTPDFKRYYPTSVLSTAKDIIFFWVARMNFAGLELAKKLPYHHVYIHPTVLDERGAVMSKSKGNGIDPLAVIDGATKEELCGPILEARPTGMDKLIARVEKSFPKGFEGVGADALRFTLVFSCSEGQEARLSLQKFNEIGRRFITKLWNASRFVLMTLEKVPGADKKGAETEATPAKEDLWIASRRASTVNEVREALDDYDFGPVGQTLYRFVWNDYCDWFLELSKGRLQGEDPAAARQAAHVLGRTLADILRLLHPIVPFITEELWGKLLAAMDEKGLWRGQRPSSDLLILEPFPKENRSADAALEERFASLQRLVNRVRNIRANAHLTESVRLKVMLKPLDSEFHNLVEATSAVVCRLANLEAVELVGERPEGVVTSVDPSFELYVDLGRHVDLKAEVFRIDKEMAAINRKLERSSKKLINSEFLNNAPPEVVKREKSKDRELRDMLEKLDGLRKEYASGAAL